MRTHSRSRVGIGVVAGLFITGVVSINALTASGEAPSPGQTGQQVVGTLVLDVPGGSGRTGTVEYLDASGVAVATQIISADGPCVTITSTGDALLQINTTPDGNSVPVLPNDGLGILTGNQNCGVSGGISGVETLELSLDTYFDAFVGVYVSETQVSVFRPDKQGGDLTVLADPLDPEPLSQTIDLVDGLNQNLEVGGFKETLALSSTSERFNKGIYLTGATFTLVIDVNEPPVASFKFAIDATDPLIVEFDASGSTDDGQIVKYSWDFGDGSTAVSPELGTTIDPITTHTYLERGTYTVSLTVTDDNDPAETGKVSQQVTVGFVVNDVVCTVDETTEGGTVEGTVEVDDGAEPAASSLTFVRLPNGGKEQIPEGEEAFCDDIAATVTILQDGLFWDNSTEGLNNGLFQDPRALVTIEWAPIDPTEPEKLQTFINYEGILDSNADNFKAQWCLGWNGIEATMPEGPIDDKGNVVYRNVDDVDVGYFTNHLGEPTDLVPWCLIESTDFLENGFIIQTQVFYGAGDPSPFK